MFSFDHYQQNCSVLEYFCEHIHEINSLKQNLWARFFKALCILVDITCVCAQSLTHVLLFFVTPWTATQQAPLSTGFSWQEYCSALPFPSPGDLPSPGIELASLVSLPLAVRFLTTLPPGKPRYYKHFAFGSILTQCLSQGLELAEVLWLVLLLSDLLTWVNQWLEHTRLEPLVQFIARSYSDSSRNESWYSLIYNKFWKGAEMALFHLELCISDQERGKSRGVELKHDLKFRPFSCPPWMYLKWKRQTRLRPQSPPLKSDGWFSSVWELQGLPHGVAVTPAEKGCHRFGMPCILCYFLLPQVKCQPRSVRAQTADEKECGAGCIPGYREGRRWKSGRTHFSMCLTQLNCCTQHLSFNTAGLMFDTREKKNQKSTESVSAIFFFSIVQWGKRCLSFNSEIKRYRDTHSCRKQI